MSIFNYFISKFDKESTLLYDIATYEDALDEKYARLVKKITQILQCDYGTLLIYNKENKSYQIAYSDNPDEERIYNIFNKVCAMKDSNHRKPIYEKSLSRLGKSKEIIYIPLFQPSNSKIGMIVIEGNVGIEKTIREPNFYKLTSSMACSLYIIKEEVEKKYLQYTNSSSGLYSEELLHKALNKILNNKNNEKNDYVLAAINICGMKNINNVYGYSLGNVIIYRVSAILKEVIQENENAYHLYGDKFMLLLNSNYRVAYERLTTLSEQIKEECFTNELIEKGSVIRISVSIGLVNLSTFKENNLDMLYKIALQTAEIKKEQVIIYGERVERETSTENIILKESLETSIDEIKKSKDLNDSKKDDKNNKGENIDKSVSGQKEKKHKKINSKTDTYNLFDIFGYKLDSNPTANDEKLREQDKVEEVILYPDTNMIEDESLNREDQESQNQEPVDYDNYDEGSVEWSFEYDIEQNN